MAFVSKCIIAVCLVALIATEATAHGRGGGRGGGGSSGGRGGGRGGGGTRPSGRGHGRGRQCLKKEACRLEEETSAGEWEDVTTSRSLKTCADGQACNFGTLPFHSKHSDNDNAKRMTFCQETIVWNAEGEPAFTGVMARACDIRTDSETYRDASDSANACEARRGQTKSCDTDNPISVSSSPSDGAAEVEIKFSFCKKDEEEDGGEGNGETADP